MIDSSSTDEPKVPSSNNSAITDTAEEVVIVFDNTPDTSESLTNKGDKLVAAPVRTVAEKVAVSPVQTSTVKPEYVHMCNTLLFVTAA